MTPATDTDDALIAHIHQLQERAAFRSCPELAVLYVRGEDRVSWLNGQLTNDVREIPPGQSVHALAVNVRGKIMAELYVADLGEALMVLVPQVAKPVLLESFERYIIMEDVSVEPAPTLQVVLVIGAEQAALDTYSTHSGRAVASFACEQLGRPARFLLVEDASLQGFTQQLASELPALQTIDEAASEVVRLRRGLARFGIDYDEQNYPQEVGLKALVSFKKGCYLGQEVVCTLENRGKLSRQLCLLESEKGVPVRDILPAPPQSRSERPALHVRAEGNPTEPAGAITSAVWDPELQRTRLLAYVRRVRMTKDATFLAGSQPVRLLHPVGEDQN